MKLPCSYANNWLDCVENSVTAFCGSEAGAWHREFEARLLESEMSSVGCELEAGGNLVVVVGGATTDSSGCSQEVHADVLSMLHYI